MTGSYEQASVGEPVSSGDPKILAQLKGMNEALNSENDLTVEGIAKGNLGRFYPPTIIATEQERTNTAYGTLTTADEVKNVVLPANGFIAVAYAANWKNSGGGEKAQAAIFLGANQLKSNRGVQKATASGAEFKGLSTFPGGLATTGEGTAMSTTGETVGTAGNGGFTLVFAEAGTYNVSVQFKAESGSVTAKERKLWVGVIGGS